MKKIILILMPFLLAALLWFVALPYLINTKIEAQLTHIGFKESVIGRTDISLHRVSAHSIQLDNEGKTRIKTISIGASPFAFLMGHHVEALLIDGLTSQIEFKDIRASLYDNRNLPFLKFLEVPVKNIEIKNFNIVMPTAQTIQNLTGHIHVKSTNKDDVKMITGILDNTSTIASLSTSIQGEIDPKGNGFLNFEITEIGIDTPFIDLNRASGWFSYMKEIEGKAQIAAQIDAGAGSIFKTAAKNISFVLGKTNIKDNDLNLVLRAQAVGVEGVTLSTDIHLSHAEPKIVFGQSVLEAKEFGDFLKYLNKTQSKNLQNLSELFALKDTQIAIRYLNEKRFADGPLPFNLKVISQEQDIMIGTFLIYPNDLQVRGSAQTKNLYTNDIKSLLSLSDEQVSGSVLRLDGNLKDALF